MSERILLWQNKDKERQIAAARRIGDKALAIVDRTYGSGFPLWTPGNQELAYHNGHHGREVGRAAARMCIAVGLDPVKQTLADSTGNAHDLIQLKGRGVDEGESAAWMTAALQETTLFSAEDQTMAQLAIIGTEPLFTNGKLTGQRATELDYPSKEAELFAKSVASGDLGGLYTPEGPFQSHQLFREIHGNLPSDELPFEKLAGFQTNQIELLETYRYPLAKAETILATHRSEVIAHSQAVLAGLEAGTIESWDEVIGRDREFMSRHN